ncbi:hypothetical protein FRC04_002318 [Tulasnella sp. 424]|nr:hypothetical protein FRC04_002318 [Tulasnella sp. 424]KAG8977391.1 hypothetical protein FRC05_001789 [Tulasnella sp. 425]
MAGVENGTQCYCGNSLSKNSKSSACTRKCGGNSSLVCGGSWALNIYQKTTSTSTTKQSTTTTTKTTTTKTTTTTTKSSATTTSPASSNGSWYRTNGSNSGKLVIAHVIFGNTYSYTPQQWIDEIKMASAQGIDGFALNFGYDYWQSSQMQSAYDAATASGTGFKMFFSLDMSVLRCDDDDTIRSYINKFKDHPAQLKDASGNMWITTFDGGNCKTDAQWNNVLRTNGVGIKFVPGFFNDETYIKMKELYPSINGDFWWGPAWPKYNNVIDWSEDNYRIERGGLTKPPDVYMSSVSPAFYVHYDGRNRVLRSDDHLYARRWEDLVSHRNVVDALQIVTWNDYGESTYIGPIRKDMPSGTTWVPGFDHTPFLQMTGYYVSAFKTGQYPTITSDKIFFWGRPHSKYATATNDGIGRPVNWDWTDDLLWIVLFSTGSGSLKVTMGSSSSTFSVTAGVNKFTLPLAQASSVTAVLTRNGDQVFNFQSNAVTYTSGNPSTYNWNYAAAAGP